MSEIIDVCDALLRAPDDIAAQCAAVLHDPRLIRYIKTPSPTVQRLAVLQSAFAIQHIPAPCAAAQVAAVHEFGGPGILRLVNGPLAEAAICAALRQDVGETLVSVQHLPPALQRLALALEPTCFAVLRRRHDFDATLEIPGAALCRHAMRRTALPLLAKGPRTDGLNADQLMLLRRLDVEQRADITVREIKAMTWGDSAYLAALARHSQGAPVTGAAIRALPHDTLPAVTTALLARATRAVEAWTSKDQAIFPDRANQSLVYALPGEAFGLTVDMADRLDDIDLLDRHPKVPAGRQPRRSLGYDPQRAYTLGWVRFTRFGRDIWIDEVQSDLKKIFGGWPLGAWGAVPEAILLDFVRRMRRRGAERFYLPTIEMKVDPAMYGTMSFDGSRLSMAPRSVYRALPKKLRFRLRRVAGLHERVNGRPAWVLD